MKRYEIYLLMSGLVSIAFMYLVLEYKHRFHVIIFSISVVVFVFLAFFFRNPLRKIEKNTNAILAPADGTILSIEQTEDGRTEIYIFLSLLDAHRFRNPVSGIVKSIVYTKGDFQAAYNKHAKNKNEANKVTIKTETNEIVEVTQLTGFIARRIDCYINEGDRIEQGELFGMIYFGSGCILNIPAEYQLADNIKIKTKIRAGLNIMATKR